MLELLSKSKPALNLINCVLGGSGGMRGKSLLNEKVIIILSLNQSETSAVCLIQDWFQSRYRNKRECMGAFNSVAARSS